MKHSKLLSYCIRIFNPRSVFNDSNPMKLSFIKCKSSLQPTSATETNTFHIFWELFKTLIRIIIFVFSLKNSLSTKTRKKIENHLFCCGKRSYEQEKKYTFEPNWNSKSKSIQFHWSVHISNCPIHLYEVKHE